MLLERRCDKDVVGKTLLERRCEKIRCEEDVGKKPYEKDVVRKTL